MKKLKLELQLALPEDASLADPCVERLLASLRSKAGVIDAHVEGQSEGQARLCVHFDPERVPLAQVESLVRASGTELATRFGHVSVAVEGMRHERQSDLVQGALMRESGVLHAAARFGTRRVEVEFDPRLTERAAVLRAIERAGLKLVRVPRAARIEELEHEHEGHEHEEHEGEEGEHRHGGPFGERSELVFSLACGAATALGWLCSRLDLPSAALGLFILAYLLGSWFTLQEVSVAIRARRFEIDFLMLIAAAGAAILGQWFEGALLLFLFGLGHALEGFAMSRARNALKSLATLVPQTALRLAADGSEQEVGIDRLAPGDSILVKPNTRIPADGFVAEGAGSVNQAPITGESVPVDKHPVDDITHALATPQKVPAESHVFAGSINGAAALKVIVTRPAADSTLARVVRLVTEARAQKSPTQLFTDRFERVFVPVILGVVVLLFFAWLVVDEPFSASFYRAMAVLVAASPCALAIATPSAVLSGVARAARGGVLVKGGAHLESLGTIHAFAFDKTGTITEGKPRLTDILPLPGIGQQRLLEVAVAVEKLSDHPLAAAIVAGSRGKLSSDPPEATDVKAITGFGVQAKIGGRGLLIGKPGLFTRNGGSLGDTAGAIAERLQNEGRSVMLVQEAGEFLGALGVMDTPRESARAVVKELQRLGIRRTILLTGDNQKVAEAVAKEVGIDESLGDLLPEQKVTAVAELARGANHVAMVGDGVNDAPALTSATVGIAMGAGSSDVALETADVALMGDDLRALPFILGLSRACRRIIRQNLWASLGMVGFLIPATIFGFAGIGVAVVLHEGSTLLVVANALRLLAYRDNRAPPGPGIGLRHGGVGVVLENYY